jgi:hypothetical protein
MGAVPVAGERQIDGTFQVFRPCHVAHPFALSSQAGHVPQP